MIVLAIPYWEVDKDKRTVLQDCVNSFTDYDRLIILSGRQPTLPNAWNQLLRLSFGMGADYVVLANDDVILTDGSLKDLCKPGTVVSPTVNMGTIKKFHAHIFSLPRDVYEKVGEFDEKFTIYWADTDYCKRLVDAGVPIETNKDVNVLHPEPARTLRYTMGVTEKSDRDIFVEKWGKEYFDPSMGR